MKERSGLKPQTSDQSLKSRKANILQKSKETFRQVATEDCNDYEPYGRDNNNNINCDASAAGEDENPQTSQRSYKSLTSRLFPKVSLS